ncbi:protein disulfide-isomerase [Clonorchis sinensis]|uniref:Protein disulfide-isomerase n=1 Tax=Clonorchis sinensis TaxID=79923 RepID=G7YCA2_CLOSI|nr:protein disulfide-isomerase [Clonorchis sinensis]
MSVSRLPSRSHASTSSGLSTQELMKELELTRIKIKRLELEADAAKRIKEYQDSVQQDMEKLDELARSMNSRVLEFCPASNEQCDAVKRCVNSIPDPKELPIPVEQDSVINPPNIHLCNADARQDDRLLETVRLVQTCMGLSARQLPKFDGNRADYHSFMRSFMSTVARLTRDPADRFSYLVHHCEGEAAQAIRRCSVPEPEEGYAEALRRFGDPHIIATTSIEELTEGPTLRADDHKALITLADGMMICSATLKQLQYQNDLNSYRTIGAIVVRLPGTMQNEWFNLAAKSFKFKRDPTFDELATFISDKADAVAAQLVYTIGRSQTEDLNLQLERMFNLEFIEAACTKRAMSLNDRVTYERMLTSLELVEGHYQIPLPWKDGSPCLPDNKGLALRRLFVLKGRLERDPIFKRLYCEKIEEYGTMGMRSD